MTKQNSEKSSRTARRIKKSRKIKNIETDQNSRKTIKNIKTGQNSRKVITNIETGQNSRKVTTNTETGQNSEKWSRKSRWMNRIEIEDRNQDMSEFMQNELTDRKLQQEILKKFVMNLLMDQKLEQRTLKEFAMTSLMDQKLEQENMKELMVKCLMDQKLKQDDDVTDQNVNQSRTTENDSERDVLQIRNQEKVETIWLFDTRADAHVIPKLSWEQLGEPSLQTTRVTLRGANGQGLGAMGEVQVRGFIGNIKVQFAAVVARDARRCLLSGTQLRTKEYTFTLHNTGVFSRQRKSNEVTRKKQSVSQSCVHAEALRCTVGNLPDVETRVGKCETRIARRHDWTAWEQERKRSRRNDNGREKWTCHK